MTAPAESLAVWGPPHASDGEVEAAVRVLDHFIVTAEDPGTALLAKVLMSYFTKSGRRVVFGLARQMVDSALLHRWLHAEEPRPTTAEVVELRRLNLVDETNRVATGVYLDDDGFLHIEEPIEEDVVVPIELEDLGEELPVQETVEISKPAPSKPTEQEEPEEPVQATRTKEEVEEFLNRVGEIFRAANGNRTETEDVVSSEVEVIDQIEDTTEEVEVNTAVLPDVVIPEPRATPPSEPAAKPRAKPKKPYTSRPTASTATPGSNGTEKLLALPARAHGQERPLSIPKNGSSNAEVMMAVMRMWKKNRAGVSKESWYSASTILAEVNSYRIKNGKEALPKGTWTTALTRMRKAGWLVIRAEDEVPRMYSVSPFLRGSWVAFENLVEL